MCYFKRVVFGLGVLFSLCMAFGVSAQASGIGVVDSLQPTDSSSIVEGSMLSRDGDAGLSYVNDRIYIFVDDSQEMEDGSFYS